MNSTGFQLYVEPVDKQGPSKQRERGSGDAGKAAEVKNRMPCSETASVEVRVLLEGAQWQRRESQVLTPIVNCDGDLLSIPPNPLALYSQHICAASCKQAWGGLGITQQDGRGGVRLTVTGCREEGTTGQGISTVSQPRLLQSPSKST